MGELSGHSTFVIGLRVDEDGDLRFAAGDNVIEMWLSADDVPLAMRKVRLAEAEETDLAHRGASEPE